MARIFIEQVGRSHHVMFQDETGMSTLAKEPTREKAEARAKYHRNRRKNGYLLSPDDSAYS